MKNTMRDQSWRTFKNFQCHFCLANMMETIGFE